SGPIRNWSYRLELLVSTRGRCFGAKCVAEKALAREAKSFVEDAMSGGHAILSEIEPDKYSGRVVARVEADGVDIGAALADAGLAVTGARGNWCPMS
ncbi:MAG: thermonuclease family protein, partial [Marinicaulis sp.]|nr:thermonuclease family protein [Marinicaulis sp.]